MSNLPLSVLALLLLATATPSEIDTAPTREPYRSPNSRAPVLSEDEIVRRASIADAQKKFSLIFQRNIPRPLRASLVAELAATAAFPEELDFFSQDPDTPSELLAKFATMAESPALKLNLCRHPATPEATLLTLSTDRDRSVSIAARNTLQRRFPATWTKVGEKLPPLAPAEKIIAPEVRWVSAMASHDLNAMREIAQSISRRQLMELLRASKPRLIADYWPEGFAFFLEKWGPDPGFNEPAYFIAEAAFDPRWLAHFQALASQDSGLFFRALSNAMTFGADHFETLVRAGFPLDEHHQQLLPRALYLRDIDLVKRLHPGSLSTTESAGLLADALRAKFAAGIRLFDSQAEHTELIRELETAFPPVPNSPLIGRWRSTAAEGNRRWLMLRPDGTGILIDGYACMISWRNTSEDSIGLWYASTESPTHFLDMQFTPGPVPKLTVMSGGSPSLEFTRHAR